MKKRKKTKAAPRSETFSLLRRPWLFAGAVFGLDLAMLVIGMVLSGMSFTVNYTANGDEIVKDDPLSFFGVIAAVVLGINCLLIALILAGSFSKKNRGAVILGAAGLLLVSLAMIGSSAYMALGSPVRSQRYFVYTDEDLRLIAEESDTYFGKGAVSFYLTSAEEENGKAVLLARTDISEFADSEDRYAISWTDDGKLSIDFVDGVKLRTLTVAVDRSQLEVPEIAEEAEQ